MTLKHRSWKPMRIGNGKIALLITAVAVSCSGTWFGWSATRAVAQDDEPTVTRFETYWEPQQDGETTRLVPRTKTITSAGVSSLNRLSTFEQFPTNAPTLPHAREVAELAKQIVSAFAADVSTDAPVGQPLPGDDNPNSPKTRLIEMLGDQFDFMHDQQQAQIDGLEARLEKLKSQHQARAEAREEIITRRTNELLGRPDPLAWDPNPSARINYPARTGGYPTAPVTFGAPANIQSRPQISTAPRELPQQPSLSFSAQPQTSSSNGSSGRPFANRFDPSSALPIDGALTRNYDTLIQALGEYSVIAGKSTRERLNDSVRQTKSLLKRAEAQLKERREKSGQPGAEALQSLIEKTERTLKVADDKLNQLPTPAISAPALPTNRETPTFSLDE
ncbi:hypothetical protein NHH03_20465 [Stieleria sp. TO1_6]|uniref:hypothetical protein n=1 Tax=Stieleria tagensis TaxID=2956795 RepID=UPI00209B69B8|nr:hypothetical protein [Stieleria tagensis]MCO8124130.1 hypothetical protein [Stieleria tagensis]